MAVNRVVLQHFSMNLELGCTENPPLLEPSAILEPCLNRDAEGTALFGLSPPSESRLIQRRKAQSLTKKYDSNELSKVEDKVTLNNHITANTANKTDSMTSVTTTLEGKKIGNLIVVASSPTSTPAPVVVVASPSGWTQKWTSASVRTWFINYNFSQLFHVFYCKKYLSVSARLRF